jgi:hypothetical protein
MHPHGNFVVQTWVRLLQDAARAPQAAAGELQQVAQQMLQKAINVVVSVNPLQLAQHANGCRVIQRLAEMPNCKELVALLCAKGSLDVLVTDPHGNYVIQEFMRNHELHKEHGTMLAVMESVCQNFQNHLQRYHIDHQWSDRNVDEYDGQCLWACNIYGRFVVEACFSLKEADCPGLSKIQHMIVRMVLRGEWERQEASRKWNEWWQWKHHPWPPFAQLSDKNCSSVLEALVECAKQADEESHVRES